MNAFLEPLGYGKIMGLDNVAAVCARVGLPSQEQVANFGGDKLFVPLDVFFIDIEACGFAEQSLDLGYACWPHELCPFASCRASDLTKSRCAR
jgi:hypothetical protein